MHNFRKTLLTIVLFVVLAAVFSGVIMAVYLRGENYYYQDIRERDERSGTIDFMVSGSSHGLTALIPDILDEDLGVDSYNMSIASGSMQDRYELLELELARNPVDTVVVEISHDALTRTSEDRGFEGAFYLMAKLKPRERTRYFFQAIHPSDYVTVYYDFMNKGLKCIKMLFTGTWTAHNDEADKGYSPLHEGETDKSWIAYNYAEQYNLFAYWTDINEEEMYWLNRILDLCEEQGVEVLLTTMPVSKTEICVNSNFDEITGWYRQIAEERGLRYIDFNLYKEHFTLFSDEEDYNDSLHLSVQGAKTFSRLFTEVYGMIQNGEDISDLFYDSYEELEEHADYYPGTEDAK